jgi:hypothetical protein
MRSIVTAAATRSEQRLNNTTAQPAPAHIHISASFVYFGATCATKWTLSGAFISYLPRSETDIQSPEYKLRKLPSVSTFCYNAVLRIRNFSSNTHFCFLLAACSSSPLPIVLSSSYSNGTAELLCGYSEGTAVVQRGYSSGTARVQQWYSESTVGVQRGYSSGTARVQQWYSESTVRVQRGYSSGTARVQQWYSESTVRVQRGYSESTVGVQREYSEGTEMVQREYCADTARLHQWYSKSIARI